MAETTFSRKLDWLLAAMLLIFAGCLGGAVYLSFQQHHHGISQATRDQLAAVAELKARQISTWYQARLNESTQLLARPGLLNQIGVFLSQNTAGGAKVELRTRLATLLNRYHYDQILLIDTQHLVRLSVPEGSPALDATERSMTTEALRTRQVAVLDLHRMPDTNGTHIDVLVPLAARSTNRPPGTVAAAATDSQPPLLGVLLIQMSAHGFLYPLIQSWPTPSQTAETELVRREGDTIVYLNELRFYKPSPLALRLPLSSPELPAAMAVRGQEGVFEGRDYRDMPVVAATRAIAGTPWFLVTKIDQAEMLGAIHHDTWFFGWLVAFLVALLTLGTTWIWRLRNRQSQRQKQALMHQSQALSQRILELTRKLEEYQHQQAVLLGQLPHAIMTLDLANHIITWNAGGELLYGWSEAEIVGQSADAVLYAPGEVDIEQARQLVLAKGTWTGELRKLTKSGQAITVQSRWKLVADLAGQPAALFVIDTDVTERKKFEAEVLRAQRMDSIGRLASGIAHDLNNVLAPILMAVHILREEMRGDTAQSVLNTLESNAQRGGSIVKQLLTFARGMEDQKVALQPRHLIKEMAKMVQETFPKSVILKTVLPKDLWLVSGDATQLHQVFLNLCVNSRDAMPQGGVLALTAENIYLDETFTKQAPEAKPGPYVLVQVSDTGTGIPPEILGKIFDPFFSTKSPEQGTGLGLSTVMNIVKNHHGFVQVKTQMDQGTLFKIYLPAVVDATTPPSETTAHLLLTGQGETILVVDDEEGVRDITRQILQKHGYRVITASEGAEAVAIYAQHRDEIKVVLTDMMMPYMDGLATIRALQKINPHVKFISASGLGNTPQQIEAAGLKIRAFLKKPFTAEQLLSTLHELLSESDRYQQE